MYVLTRLVGLERMVEAISRYTFDSVYGDIFDLGNHIVDVLDNCGQPEFGAVEAMRRKLDAIEAANR